MITPRQTRILRVPDLRTFHRRIAELTRHGDLDRARATIVLVPSRSAAAELRTTLERLRLGDAGSSPLACVFPDLLTRDEWYAAMHGTLADPPARLSDVEREILMAAACRDAVTAGVEPPFRVRPPLVAAILDLYDELHRRGQTIDRFEALLVEELEGPSEYDRGAARMLQQTRFLAAAFRGYDVRGVSSRALDEHALRRRLLDGPAARPVRQVVVTMGDRGSDPVGLWPADFDLLTRLPLLEQIDVVATARELDAGWLERLRHLLPGAHEIDEGRSSGEGSPVLSAPSVDHLAFVARDREEELVRIARLVKADRRRSPTRVTPLHRQAVVFRRPLPYLYLARQIFGAAGIPFQTLDSFPLASEPYAATVDLALSAVASGFTRADLVALLGSPHLSFVVQGTRIGLDETAALNEVLAAEGYLGDPAALARLAASHPMDGSHSAARALRAAADAAATLQPLAGPDRASRLVEGLLTFLTAHGRLPDSNDPGGERHLRARAAVLGVLRALQAAFARHADPESSLEDLAGTIRRWIENRTFALRAGSTGLHLVDAAAARYGDFDRVHVVGLIDDEWPAPAGRNVFYAPSLLARLGWSGDVQRLPAARASFGDLLTLARNSVWLSTFSLEDDALVQSSPFLAELADMGLSVEVDADDCSGRVFRDEALSEQPVMPDVLKGPARDWVGVRLGRSPASDSRFHGVAGPHQPPTHSIVGTETYLSCPFKFFATKVLRLEEEIEDETVMTARTRGQFVHEIFETFFAEWHARGRRRVTLELLEEARTLFAAIVERAVARLPESEGMLERTRLLGSPASVGVGETVFRMEAGQSVEIVERLLEYRLEGEFEFERSGERRRVGITANADRIDLLTDDTLRVIDYKTGRPPKPARALQLPLYSLCAVEHLKGRHGRQWTIGEAAYIAFAGPRPFVPLVSRRSDLPTVLADAQTRFLDAIDGMARGEFPPRPLEPFLCTFCAYSNVCRKDYVGDE